ncbi:hypothetical protein NKH70_33105 [Mesorhizobium sp. M0991]|uniref:hypothetical protein n=1 Tax=Mesorhizobium sp. M0991 TaxID=2957043 RepID=UPI003336CD1D
MEEKALAKARRRIAELEQKVGQQQLDLDFFKKPCGISGTITGRTRRRQTGSANPLLGKLRQRRHPNVAAVALANNNARILWSMLSVRCLSTGPVGESSLTVSGEREGGLTLATARKWQDMAKRSPRRFQNLVCGPARLRQSDQGWHFLASFTGSRCCRGWRAGFAGSAELARRGRI